MRERDDERRRERAWAVAAPAVMGVLLCGIVGILWLQGRRAGRLAETEKVRAVMDAKRNADLNAVRAVVLALDTVFPMSESRVREARAVIDAAVDALERLPERRAQRDELRRRATLRGEQGSWTDWAFDDPRDLAAHQALTDYVETATPMTVEKRGALGMLERRFVAAPTPHPANWDGVIEMIGDRTKNPIYGGRTLPSPQFGLWPLGKDKASGLFEFAHLYSGDLPTWDAASERVVPTDDMAIVFVLIPGGTFLQGAQREKRAVSNFDEQAEVWESDAEGRPVERTVGLHFIAKYECTQAQWERLTGGERPSGFHGPRRPVEQISWDDAVGQPGWLSRYGLGLPTESQWEFACRAPLDRSGARRTTYTPWHSGPDEQSLARVAVVDADGSADVGSKDSNEFGLYDLHGNVREWCRDGYERYHPTPTTEPVAVPFRVHRGGSWFLRARFARSAFRFRDGPRIRKDDLGVRPARPVMP